jgi:uncharacterized protein (DUF305 family)
MQNLRFSTSFFLILLWLLITACTPAATDDSNGNTMDGMDHSSMDDMAEMEAGVDAIAALSGDEFEIAFLDAMIPHHQSAVDMAEIALERSETPETRAVAEAIITAQEAEIAQMTMWLSDWHGRNPSGDAHGMAMPNETEALRTIPAEEFDQAFYTAMIPHHESAIAMAELVAERTERPELLALATAIITTQQAEIAQFQAWLSDAEGG